MIVYQTEINNFFINDLSHEYNRKYPASIGFSFVFPSVVLPFSSRFWLLAFCTETTKTKREQPKRQREWQYNAEKHKGKASASRVNRKLHYRLTK